MNLSKKALLVIDMQKGSFTPKTPRFDAVNVVKRINKLSAFFREHKHPVFFIQHDGTGTSAFEKGTLEWENLDDLTIELSDVLIDKYANDVFYNSNLQSKLTELEINELFITGCATDFCVASTVQSAIVKDYNITVVEDAHTTADRPNLQAEQVITHYNWVWQNMIPTKGVVKVEKTEKICLTS